jgi:flagellar biosynthesis chaperone FliJ
MIISQTQIKQIADQLKTLITEREECLKSTVATFKSWRDIDEFLDGLRSAMKKMHTVIANEEKEIQSIKRKFRELEFIKEINTNDPKSERSLVAYVESQSIITNPSTQLTTAVDNVTVYLNKMEKFISNRLSKKWLTDKSSSTERRVETQSKERPPRPKERALSKKSSDRNVYRFESKPFTEALAILAEEGRSIKRKDSVPLKNVGNFLDIKPIPEIPELSNELKKSPNLHKRDKGVVLDSAEKKKQLNSQECKENVDGIANQVTEKRCSICKKSEVLMVKLKCCGEVCPKCLKRRILECEPKVILNPFEAEKRQVAMCVCSIHKSALSFTLLQILFSTKELENFSIEALRRQKKNRRVKHPNICGDCKGVMKDNIKAVSVCSKHKICEYCNM